MLFIWAFVSVVSVKVASKTLNVIFGVFIGTRYNLVAIVVVIVVLLLKMELQPVFL